MTGIRDPRNDPLSILERVAIDEVGDVWRAVGAKSVEYIGVELSDGRVRVLGLRAFLWVGGVGLGEGDLTVGAVCRGGSAEARGHLVGRTRNPAPLFGMRDVTAQVRGPARQHLP